MKAWIFLAVTGLMMQMQATSCRSCKKENNSQLTSQQNKMTKELIVDETFKMPEKNDPFTIKAIRLNGNVLDIDVEYSGGCKDHEFTLYFNKIFMKSLPPKAKFFLVHDANEDTCRELITKTYSFNITPSRYPDNKTKEIIVMIDGFNESVSYRYD